MLYIIMGTGKCGTSLIAETLHKSGIPMITNINLDKRHERVTTKMLNNGILRSNGVVSYRIKPPIQKGLSSFEIAWLKDIISMQPDVWGFKDPRTILTYDLIRPHLPRHKLIMIYRHPVQVWHHYKTWPWLASAITESWIQNNKIMMNIYDRDSKKCILLEYEKFMRWHNEILRLAAFTGKKLVELRDPKFFRNRKKFSPLVWGYKGTWNALQERYQKSLGTP